MKVYLPRSLNSEIEYWQKYREKYIAPAIRETHSTEHPSVFILSLLGRSYNMPLEVTGYSLDLFAPLPQPSVLKNFLVVKGQDVKQSIEEMKKVFEGYGETVLRASPGRLKLAKHVAVHREQHATDMPGKIVGQLISTPIQREFADDDAWLEILEGFFGALKSKEIFEGMSGLRRRIAERVYRGSILDYASIFANVVYYESTREYSAYTPDRQKLDIEFYDLKTQKELREHRIIRFLKRLDRAIPSSPLMIKDDV